MLGEKLFASNIKLAGYLDLDNGPLFLGISHQAYIETNLTSSSVDIVNLTGDIYLVSDHIYISANGTTASNLIKYSSDLSGSYDARTLVDKGYVDSVISPDVLATILTGFIVGSNTPIVNTDTVLSAFEKIQGQLNNIESGLVVSVNGFSGVVNLTTTDIPEGSNLYYLDSRARNSISVNLPLTYNSGTGVISINQANTTTSGYLSSADWNTFNSKVNHTDDLNYLNDVLYPTGTPVDGQLLVYNGTSGKWEPTSFEVSKIKSWSFGGSNNSNNTTNMYLSRFDGTPLNESPYIAYYNCELNAFSLSSNVASTWTAEVHINGISVATLSSGGLQYASVANLSIVINTGDRISFYVNGTNVNKPSIDALFIEA